MKTPNIVAAAIVLALSCFGGTALAACQTSITSGPADPSNSTSASFSFTSSGCSHGAYECKMDGGSYSSCTSPKSYSGLSNTTHTFAVHYTNQIPAFPSTWTWRIDTAVPNPTPLAPSTNEDTPVSITLHATDQDTPPSSPLTFAIVSLYQPFHGSLGSIGTPSCTASGNGESCDASVTFTPEGDFNGTAAFIYSASDPFQTRSADVTITVNAVNDKPTASSGSASTNEDTAVAVTLSGADIDSPKPPNLSYSVVTGPSHGSLGSIGSISCTNSGAGQSCSASVTYTPSADFNGSDSFTFKTNDGSLDSSAATLSLTINAVNDAPVATADSYSTNESTMLDVPFPGVLSNDSDVEGNPLTAVPVATPSHGKLVLQASGAFAYTPTTGYKGSDSFTYHASDGSLSSSDVTVSLTVTAMSTADSATSPHNGSIETNVIANDAAEFSTLNPTPTEEAHFCYDGFDAACGGSDSSDVRNTSGRLSRVTDKPGFVVLSYDSAGRATVTSQTIGSGSALVTTATLDANGNATGIAYPSGITVSRIFDETDRETAITWSGGGSGTLATSIAWFPFGGLSSWASAGSPAVTMSVTQDTAGWITQVAAAASPSPTSISYAYANDGNVKAIPSSTSPPNVLHDSLSRLIKDRGRTRAYDDAGNVTTSNGFALSYPLATSDRWSAADAGAISYVFDSAGNATQRGSIGLLTGDDGTVIAIDHATYGRTAELRDRRNLRVMRQGAAGDETYLYSRSGKLVQKIGASVSVACGSAGLAQTSTPIENYVYAGGRRVGMVRATISEPCGGGGGTTVTAEGGYLYFADKMDLPHAIYRNSDGARVWTADFDAFGVPLALNENPDGDSVTIQNAFELPGQVALSAIEGGPSVASGGGLVENWNRIYDSEVGRYLEPDRLHGSRRRPQTLGRYSYSGDSPLRWVDPDGKRMALTGWTLAPFWFWPIKNDPLDPRTYLPPRKKRHVPPPLWSPAQACTAGIRGRGWHAWPGDADDLGANPSWENPAFPSQGPLQTGGGIGNPDFATDPADLGWPEWGQNPEWAPDLAMPEAMPSVLDTIIENLDDFFVEYPGVE